MPHYLSPSGAGPRIYPEINGGNQFIANSVAENEGLRPNIDVRDLPGSMTVAWPKLFLDEEES